MKRQTRFQFLVLLALLFPAAVPAAEPPAGLASDEMAADAAYQAIFAPASCESPPAAPTLELPVGLAAPAAEAVDGGFCCISCDTGTSCGTPIACCVNRDPRTVRCCKVT